MGKRYGRNQKRHHRERIAELEARLRRGAGIPRRGEPDIESMVSIVGTVDTFSSGQSCLDEREVRLNVYGAIDPLIELGHRRGVVEYQGGRYVMEMIEMPPVREPIGQGLVITVSLRGIA